MINKPNRKTFLFTLRIWAEPLENDQVEWRGKLQPLPEGEANYFRGWQELVERLEKIMSSIKHVEHRPPNAESGSEQ